MNPMTDWGPAFEVNKNTTSFGLESGVPSTTNLQVNVHLFLDGHKTIGKYDDLAKDN